MQMYSLITLIDTEGPKGWEKESRERKGLARLRDSGGSVGEASAFSSGHDLRVLGLSPVSGSLLSGESASLSVLPPARSLSQINKILKNKTKQNKTLELYLEAISLIF